MGAHRVICLSDTHLHRRGGLPGWCLSRLAGADMILHAGDLVALSVFEELAQLAPLEAVSGNMDALALKEALPRRQITEIGGVRIGLVHDPGPVRGRALRLAADFPTCDAIVFGHTHVPGIERLDRCLVLNPGSPTAPRSTLGATLIELTIVEGKIEPSIVTP
ncbi:MAG: metallophosphoesterase [Gaiellaceae bacterium]